MYTVLYAITLFILLISLYDTYFTLTLSLTVSISLIILTLPHR